MTIIDKLKKSYELQKEVNSYIDTTEMTKAKLLDAFVVEIFEFWNVLEPFKWWKKNKDKPREKALEELADAFAFAIVLDITYADKEKQDSFDNICERNLLIRTLEVSDYIKENGMQKFIKEELEDGASAVYIVLDIAFIIFTLDELFEAHAKKSQINIERQKNNY